MKGFFYSVALQWRLDLRSRTLLITCYLVPLLFFLLMGGIFTAVMPGMKATLVQTMLVMTISMAAFIGYPPSLAEIYGTDVKKVYRANGVPLALGLATTFLSAFIHLQIVSCILLLLAPALFGAALPASFGRFFVAMALYSLCSLGVGSLFGLAIKNQAKLTMAAQLAFLPSLLLSGVMFPIELLPPLLEKAGRLFPAYWGYRLMLDGGLQPQNLWYLLLVACLSALFCGLLLKRQAQQ